MIVIFPDLWFRLTSSTRYYKDDSASYQTLGGHFETTGSLDWGFGSSWAPARWGRVRSSFCNLFYIIVLWLFSCSRWLPNCWRNNFWRVNGGMCSFFALYAIRFRARAFWETLGLQYLSQIVAFFSQHQYHARRLVSTNNLSIHDFNIQWINFSFN